MISVKLCPLNPQAGVVAAAVNVLCELARKNPADYLSLAPQLFHLLTTSTNNWMLIKLIKLVRAFHLVHMLYTKRRSTLLVRCPDTSRTQAREEAPASHHRHHIYHPGCVAIVRMRTHMYHRRDAAWNTRKRTR